MTGKYTYFIKYYPWFTTGKYTYFIKYYPWFITGKYTYFIKYYPWFTTGKYTYFIKYYPWFTTGKYTYFIKYYPWFTTGKYTKPHRVYIAQLLANWALGHACGMAKISHYEETIFCLWICVFVGNVIKCAALFAQMWDWEDLYSRIEELITGMFWVSTAEGISAKEREKFTHFVLNWSEENETYICSLCLSLTLKYWNSLWRKAIISAIIIVMISVYGQVRQGAKPLICARNAV